jgi:hypothetical protein
MVLDSVLLFNLTAVQKFVTGITSDVFNVIIVDNQSQHFWTFQILNCKILSTQGLVDLFCLFLFLFFVSKFISNKKDFSIDLNNSIDILKKKRRKKKN